jgi:hypothetical protein
LAAAAIWLAAGASASAGVEVDNAILLDPFDPVPAIQFRHYGGYAWGIYDCGYRPCGHRRHHHSYRHHCYRDCYGYGRCERHCGGYGDRYGHYYRDDYYGGSRYGGPDRQYPRGHHGGCYGDRCYDGAPHGGPYEGPYDGPHEGYGNRLDRYDEQADRYDEQSLWYEDHVIRRHHRRY